MPLQFANPSDILVQYFPQAPYNFEDSPSGAPKHNRLLLDAIAQAILDFESDAYIARGQVAITTALNAALDQHGLLTGTPRLPSEDDLAYRARILAALFAGKLTIAAIQSAVQAYFVSTGGVVPVVTVYDIQSNPTMCAQVLYVDPGSGALVHPTYNDFVVQIIFPDTGAWYLNYGYLGPDPTSSPTPGTGGSDTYLLDDSVTGVTETDENLIKLVNSIRAAGKYPVYVIGYSS